MPEEKTKTAFVTGATGFVGRHLVSRLLQGGYQVRCLIRDLSTEEKVTHGGTTWIRGDLLDVNALAQGARGADVAFHCAAMVTDWATVGELKSTNVTGTANVLDAAIAQGVKRFIHISTTDVYRHRGQLGVTEDSVTDRPFSNWYSETKYQAEQQVIAARNAGAIEDVIIRPGTVFGPGSVNVIGEIAKALQSRSMILINHGQAIAGLCYIDNLIDALMLAAESGTCVGSTLNICDGSPTTWKQFLDDLSESTKIPKAKWNLPYGVASSLGLALECGYRLLRVMSSFKTDALLSRQAVAIMGKHQDFSIGEARHVLGFLPRIGYHEALERTAQWLVEEVLSVS